MKNKNCKFTWVVILYTLCLIFYASTVGFAFADQSVSATVPPRATDFQFAFSEIDGQNTVPQGTILSYQLTYGAQHSAGLPTTTTLTADWSGATAPDNAQILDYVIGSASNAYGGTTPIVDLFNHTISWTIPALPNGVTDQKITFQLETTSNYPNFDPVPFVIHAKMNNQYLSLPDQLVSQTYQFDQSLITPTPSPKPSETPLQQTVPTPTKNPSPVTATVTPDVTKSFPIPYSSSPLQLTHFSFTNISKSQTTIALTSSVPAKISVYYGVAPTALFKTVTTTTYSSSTALLLKDLAPQTKYFAQVIAHTPDGEQASSEIFTFTTAKPSEPPLLDDNIIVVSTNGNVLLSNSQKQSASAHPAMILTTNSDVKVAYTLTKPVSLASIETVVQSKLLGANTISGIPNSPPIIIPMQEKAQNLYEATLKPVNSGLYEIYVRITDSQGNIIEKKISDLKVMSPLTVYAKDTNLPLADARVYLSYYDKKTNSYVPITPVLFGNITNPTYTDALGKIQTILPAGKYRVEESALLYDKATADFIIGPKNDEDFPKLYLTRDPLNFFSLFTFTKDYLSDTKNKIFSTLYDFSSSIRLFHLFAVGILGAFVLITLLLFTLRSHIKLQHVPILFLFHLDRLFKRHTEKYIFGTITNEDNAPLSHVRIEIEDADTNTILTHTTANNLGKFYTKNNDKYNAINLRITKEGFEPLSVFLEKDGEIPEEGLHIVLKKGSHHHVSFVPFLLLSCAELLGLLFEVSLVISLILEVLFFFLYGFTKTAPYFILSLLNLTLWLFYLKERHSN